MCIKCVVGLDLPRKPAGFALGGNLPRMCFRVCQSVSEVHTIRVWLRPSEKACWFRPQLECAPERSPECAIPFRRCISCAFGLDLPRKPPAPPSARMCNERHSVSSVHKLRVWLRPSAKTADSALGSNVPRMCSRMCHSVSSVQNMRVWLRPSAQTRRLRPRRKCATIGLPNVSFRFGCA